MEFAISDAVKWIQWLTIFNLAIQSLEIISLKDRVEKVWQWNPLFVHVPRILFCLAAVFWSHHLIWPVILSLTCLSLEKFKGPFNGGSEYMTIMVVTALAITGFWTDSPLLHRIVWYYVGAQLVISYFMAGVVKLKQKKWLNGLYLKRVLLGTFYEVHPMGQKLAQNTKFCRLASWSVIAFEVVFPMVFLKHEMLPYFLGTAFLFHLGNFFFFGLNRFVFSWLAAYPALWICLQQ